MHSLRRLRGTTRAQPQLGGGGDLGIGGWSLDAAGVGDPRREIGGLRAAGLERRALRLNWDWPKVGEWQPGEPILPGRGRGSPLSGPVKTTGLSGISAAGPSPCSPRGPVQASLRASGGGGGSRHRIPPTTATPGYVGRGVVCISMPTKPPCGPQLQPALSINSFTLPAPRGDEFVRSPTFLNTFTSCPPGATAVLSFSVTPIPSQSSWGRGCLNPHPPELMSPSQSGKESLSIGVDAPPPGVSPPPSITSLNSQLPTRKVLSPARQSRHTDKSLPQAPGW